MFSIFLGLCWWLASTHGITLPYKHPSMCQGNEFFQHSSLQCLACGANQEPDQSSELRPSCKCDLGWKIVDYNGGPLLTCQKCGSQEVTSHDGWNCVSCANGFDQRTGACTKCEAGEAAVDRSENGTPSTRKCLKCLQDTWPQSNQGACRRCDQRVLSLTTQVLGKNPCDCSKRLDTVLADGICFKKSDLIPVDNVESEYTVRYSNSKTVSSGFFRAHYRAAQRLCAAHNNYTACQLVGNLCVMQMYNDQTDLKGSSSKDVCNVYRTMVNDFSGILVQNSKDWPSTMPWLFYNFEKADVVLTRSKFERMQDMIFVFTSYHANGTFLGLSTNAQLLHMCMTPRHISEHAQRFSTPYSSTCNVMLKELLKSENIFHDMYLRIGEEVYPIPVLVANIRRRGVDVNRQSGRSSWVYTRRFFLVDNLSGRKNVQEVPQQVQYASNIDLHIQLDHDGQIYFPVLKITYGVIDVASVPQDKEVPVSFQVSYEMDVSDIRLNIQIWAGVLSGLAVVYACIRIISFRRRNGLYAIDCTSFTVFILYCCSSLAFVFLVIIIGVCLQWLFFFKNQTRVFRLLPTSKQDDLVEALFIAAFVMKGLSVAHILYDQININMFFIDWERPKGAVNNGDERQSKGRPVSIMRTLFVANEWRELQTTRKINPILLLIIFLLFFKVIGFEYWTTTDPIGRLSIDRSVDYVGEVNFTLRLGVISLVYLVIAVVLWVIFSFFYERFVADAIGDFIDFCSMSNISVCILTHQNFGYYIHGLSVHGHADVNLHQLYEQFQREEDNLCGTRGLEPNADIQTFEVAFTDRFRNDYDKIQALMMSRDNVTARRDAVPAAARQNPSLPGTTLPPRLETSVHAYQMMNRYLSSFIEHSIRDNNYQVKDKLFSEKVLQNELQLALDQSIFYKDENRSFTSILLYGQEWNFLLFHLLLLLMVDWLAGYDAVLAAIVVYFFDVFVVSARDSLGKRTLSQKTMVNERFLI